MGATAVLGEDVATGNPVPRSPRLGRPSPTVMVAVAAFGAFLAFIDSTVVNVAFPNLETSFPRTGVAGLSWVLNAYNIVFAGFLVAAGRLADLFGRRRLFKLGLAIFTLASGLCALAPSVAALVAFRAVQGAGAALLLPASLGIVVRAAPAERRSHALSVWAAAGALAAGLGPPLGGALVDLYDWRIVFIVNVPLGLLAWMLAHRLVTESRAPGRREMPDLRGAALLSLAITALTLGIVEGPAWGWSSPGVVTAFAGSAAAALLCVGSSMHHRSPVIDPRLLRIRGFTVSSAVTVAAALGLYTYLLTHILWLHDVWGYPIVVAGLAVAPGALVAAAVAGPLGRLADRRGPRAVVVPGALIWAGAFLWYLTRVGVHPDFLGAWLPGQVLSGIGVGATLPVATAGGLAAVPAGRYATASAVNSAARQVGAVMGIAILTVFIAHPTAASLPGQLRHGWEMAAIAFLVAAGAAALFGRVRATDAASSAGARAPRLRTGHLPELLPSGPAERSDLLSLLPATAREALIAAGRSLHLRAGETLVRQGDPGDTLYVLRSGRLAVQHPGSPPFALGAGSVVGELALLTRAPRSATVVARRDSALVALTRDRFDEVAAREPELLRAVAVGLAQMVQLGRPVPRDGAAAPRVIAVVALDEGVPVAALADPLRRGLTASGSLRVARIDDAEPEALERAEAEHDRVLLVAGPDGAWHDACLRQADRLLLVTGAGPRPLHGLSSPAEIVLVGAAPTEEEVAGWHDACDCRRVHHAGADPGLWPERLRPLVARLGGRSVALVLGGGGARALAHVGVLHAFEEAGIHVDRLAGASVGALIAGLYATGATASEVEARIFDELVQRNPFGDYRLSPVSLARGRRGLAMLRRCFGERRIESLPRELVVVSTDLYARCPVHHRRGGVAEALAASLSLPALFPPRRLDGRVLVDGSLTDNCPVDAFAGEHEGPVVAVQIGGVDSAGRDGRIPTLGEVLVRTMLMADRSQGPGEGPSPAAVTVVPDTRGIGLFEFFQLDEAREAGLEAGRAAIRALREGGPG